MRNRWSLLIAGFAVFGTWYSVTYVVTVGTFSGLPTGLVFGLSAIVAGLFFGAAVGAAARALELHLLHVEVRRGDARGGARVTLGKLPEIVPVAAHNGGADAPESPVTGSPAPSESAPNPSPDPAPEIGGSRTLDRDAGDTNTATPEPNGVAEDAPATDRLAIECARFVAEHYAVTVTPGAHGSSATGRIDRVANPSDFAAFMALINTLVGEGVDVVRVSVSAGPEGLPVGVTFPVFGDGGELK